MKNRLEADKDRILEELKEIKDKYRTITVVRTHEELRKILNEEEV